MRTENWCGYDIRFVEINGEWYAILKDICDALGLRTAKVSERLDPSMLERVRVDETRSRPKNYKVLSKDVVKTENTRWMLAVNEIGIYEALFASRRLEARKFRLWSASVMQKLRKNVGLEQYEVMKMTNPDIQEEIDHMLDNLFYDEETGILMESVTVAGGDVIQVPFGEDD